MKIEINRIILAATAALALAIPSCVVPEGGYVQGQAYGHGPATAYSNYTVTMADGYAGRGYYYGPPDTRYYDRGAGVTYYQTRESVPQQYWSQSRTDHHRYSQRDEIRATASAPTTSYTLRMGDGYAGRGYYYGPPDVRYYEQAPGVVYYRDIDSVPRQYRTQTTVRTGINLGL